MKNRYVEYGFDRRVLDYFRPTKYGFCYNKVRSLVYKYSWRVQSRAFADFGDKEERMIGIGEAKTGDRKLNRSIKGCIQSSFRSNRC